MYSSFGPTLRKLRGARRFSVTQLASESGVSRRTLTRWEAGDALPRLPELEAVLRTLKVTTRERQQTLTTVDAPRVIEIARNEFEMDGRIPHAGDLLRAMRMRKGWTLEQTASLIGADHSRISRWERGEEWPTAARLHELCRALGASDEEVLALMDGRRFTRTGAEGLSPRVVEEDIEQFLNSPVNPRTEAVKDLRFLALEAQTWTLASRWDAAKPLLASLYSHHAQFCSSWERFVEAAEHADQAQEIGEHAGLPPGEMLRAAIVGARAAVNRGKRPAPQRGLEILRLWTDVRADAPLMAWLRADMAKYLAQAGLTEAAIQAAELSRRLAEECNPVEQALRRLDQADILLLAGRPDEALEALPRWSIDDPGVRVNILLTEVKALQAAGECGLARDRLELAINDILTHSLKAYRVRANMLAMSLA